MGNKPKLLCIHNNLNFKFVNFQKYINVFKPNYIYL